MIPRNEIEDFYNKLDSKYMEQKPGDEYYSGFDDGLTFAIDEIGALLEKYPSPETERWSIGRVIQEILEELSKAKSQFPTWPVDPIHAASVVNEESGELVQAAMQFSYQNKSAAPLANEAIQVGAMVVRFLLNYPHYRQIQSPQREDKIA